MNQLPSVPMSVWRELLAAAIAYREARPWELMGDADNFALIDDQQNPWFPAVLGGAGQVFGLALYRGASGLRFLLKEVTGFLEMSPDVMFTQDALLLDWGGKKELQPEELKILTQLGYAPKSGERLAWPTFRSYVPGLYPWSLTETEARALTHGIRAVLACHAFVAAHPNFFAPGEADGMLFPTVAMRDALAGQLRKEQIEWRHWELPLPELPAPPVPGPEWRSSLLSLPQNPQFTIQFDNFYSSEPVDAVRPYFPRVSLMADGESGYIFGVEMGDVSASWGQQVLSVWSKAILAAGARPGAICIQREEWLPLLQPLASTLGIQLKFMNHLPFIAEARESLAQFGRSRR